MSEQITVLRGDGIDEEIRTAAIRVLDESGDFTYPEAPIGGRAMDECGGDPFPPETEALARDSRVVLLGAVGGPKWDSTDPKAPRPEDGLLALRQAMGTHANLRPVYSISTLPDASPYRPERIEGTDFLIVRELLGGSYYGDKGRSPNGDRAHDTREYSTQQIEAVGRTSFELALARAEESGGDPRVTSVDKANVLETSRLWRETITALQKAEYPDVALEHMLVDNANFQIGHDPRQFDVMVTENEFGDILSDGAANVMGALGMAPSASLNAEGAGIFEPVHGSAPDIAGKGTANPAAIILSAAMALRYTLGRPQEANRVEWAVKRTFRHGVLTADLAPTGRPAASTDEFTESVLRFMQGYSARV
ncbi:MAG TPA: 3-isopropylmalate dehydrogenase [Candidatus Saccharimonadales bacterium]|nr:3-isopropylmalate dehydrogenase [Candidatus Saccharimonadales bacterium]